jgi:hypothetical protein
MVEFEVDHNLPYREKSRQSFSPDRRDLIAHDKEHD